MKKFLVQYIVSYIGEDYTDYEYPEFEVEANTFQEAREKAFELYYNEVQEMSCNYNEDEYYTSDFEINEVKEIKCP